MVLGISPYLITIFLAWLSAHTIKFLISYFKKEKLSFKAHLSMSGGMPSSHSATTVSLLTMIALIDGIKSPYFAIATLFTAIVMYDAMKVRRSSGEQGIAIRQLIKEQNSKVKLSRVALGHTPLEVVIGASLGAIIAVVVFLSTR